MSEKQTLVLASVQQAAQQLPQVWAWIKAMLSAGHRVVLEVRLETRSDAQNRLLHSRIGDIARQVEWAGKKRDTDTWKRLLMAAWLRARGDHVEILPALDGHGVDVVFERTSKLSRAECAEFSDYVLAWGDERGVQWRPASLGREWAGILDDDEDPAPRRREAVPA